MWNHLTQLEIIQLNHGETIHPNVEWFNTFWNHSTRCEMIQCDLKLIDKIENHLVTFEMLQQLSKAFNMMWNKSTWFETI